MASNELADKLARRCKLNDDKNGEKELGPKSYRSIYAGNSHKASVYLSTIRKYFFCVFFVMKDKEWIGTSESLAIFRHYVFHQGSF